MAVADSTWEYRVLAGADEDALGRLGREGWELVAVVGGAGGEPAGATCYLKRAGPAFRERVTVEQRRAYLDGLAGATREDGE